jgi:GWxTD domain-containing protein
VRRPGVTLACLIVSAALSAQSLPDLFYKAKAQVKGESWSEALKTLDRLDAESAKPGNETARPQLEAPMAFYRGVCEANLGRTEKAQSDFETFLALQPRATMDPSMYSKKAQAAFNAARKAVSFEAAGRSSGKPVDEPEKAAPMFVAYQEFKMPRNPGEPVNATWADGPIKWIMTEDERRTWDGLASGSEWQEFVDQFWERRNPRPGNPDNVFKTTFERRVAFADIYLIQVEGMRGSLTDRGMVFVLLGPPNLVGKKPLRDGADGTETGMSLAGTRAQNYAQRVMVSAGEPPGESRSEASENLFGPWVKGPDASPNWREIWHYRKELLPKGVRYNQVDFDFVTRKGQGAFVMQRDPAAIATLDTARASKAGESQY